MALRVCLVAMDRLDLERTMAALSASRPIFHSEADFQHALAWKLQTALPQSAIRLEYKPFPSERFYLDIWVRWETGSAAIELKYPTRGLTVDVHGERFDLRHQAAQDITRYDFVKDLVRLERATAELEATTGFAVLLTNDSAYWKEALRVNSVDAAFRIAEGAKLRGSLAWGPNVGAGTARGREAQLLLRGSYEIKWREYSRLPGSSYSAFRYLLVELSRSAEQTQDAVG